MLDGNVRWEIFQASMYCGGVFATLRIVIAVGFPFLAGAFWQGVIGGYVAKRWPDMVQSMDLSHVSYVPANRCDPLVVRYAGDPPLNEMLVGLRDGFLLGVFLSLAPADFGGSLLAFILVAVVSAAFTRICRTIGLMRTEAIFYGVRMLLIWLAAAASAQAAGLV